MSDTLKHLRGRHDQKLHGNRGIAAARGRRFGTAETLAPSGKSLQIARIHTEIKGKLTGAGRSWDNDRRTYLYNYLKWVAGGKKGPAPAPEGSAIRAANHIRRSVESHPDVKALGVKAERPAPKTRTSPADEKPGEDGSTPQKPGKETVPASISKIEKGWDGKHAEEAVVYDGSGRIIIRKSGGSDYVDFTDSEMAAMKANGNAILTHNHPGGWNADVKPNSPPSKGRGFSPQDIGLAIKNNLAGVRAVARKRIFELKRPARGWGDLDEALRVYNDVEKEVRSQFYSAISSGKLTIPQAETNHHSEVARRFAKIMKYEYSIIPRTENFSPGDTLEEIMKEIKS